MLLVARRHGAEADDVDRQDRGQAPDQVGSVMADRLAEVPDGHRTILASGPRSAKTGLHASRPRATGKTMRSARNTRSARRASPPTKSSSSPASTIRRASTSMPPPPGIDVRRPDRLGLACGRQADAAVRRQLRRPTHGAGLARPRRAPLAEPVRPGDTLTAWVECAGKVPSKSRPDMGIVHEHWRATNQKGELVMTPGDQHGATEAGMKRAVRGLDHVVVMVDGIDAAEAAYAGSASRSSRAASTGSSAPPTT